MSSKIVIFGSGGVGGYFGARLAATGNDVTFVARGAHFEAMRSNGLRVLSPLGDMSLPEVDVVNRVDQIKRADFVFLTVKLWDTEQALPQLVPLAEGGATVISFQNGVQKDEVLLKVLPKPSVMSGVSYISAAIQEPGVIRHFGPIQNLIFGEFDGSRTQRAVDLLSACESARIGARISNEIEREIWEKFVFLVGLSATTATIRQPIGSIRSNAQTRGFLLDVMRETVNVGRARGVTLAKDYADKRLEFCDTLSAEMTASMYQDLLRGNRLELPWLSGSVAELGEQMGIPVPRNRAVTDILALYVAPSASLRYTEDAMPEQEVEVSLAEPKHSEGRSLAVGLTSLFFILLQSACTAFMAISGLRLLIGIGSLAAATAGMKFLDVLHGAALRTPMELVAIAGSVVNLYAVRRIRKLRARPASQWRMKPATTKQLRSESWQIGLAILTLLLVAVEWGFHVYLHGTI